MTFAKWTHLLPGGELGEWTKMPEDVFSLSFSKLCCSVVVPGQCCFLFPPKKTALVSCLAFIRVEMLSRKDTKSTGIQWSQTFWLRTDPHLFGSTLQPFETIWFSSSMVKIRAAVGEACPNKARVNWARNYGKLWKMSKRKQTFTVVLVIKKAK